MGYVSTEKLATFTEALTRKLKTILASKSDVGSPLTAATAAAMTEEDRIYVYTGSETGYVAGNWYYYDGSAWTSGGVYNATAFTTDTTLTLAGKAADSQKVGDNLTRLRRENVAYGAVPLIPEGPDETNKRGIDYSWDITRLPPVCTFSGTCVTAESQNKLIDSTTALPAGFQVGESYKLKFDATDDAIRLAVRFYKSGTGQPITYCAANSETVITVPTGATGLAVYLAVSVGDEVDGTCTVQMLSTRTNAQLAGQVDTLRENVAQIETENAEVLETTKNLYFWKNVEVGKNSGGSSAVYRAMSAPIKVGSNGVTIRTIRIPEDAEFKAVFYAGEALSSQISGRISNQWATEMNVSTTAFPNTYLRLEWNFPSSHTVTLEDFEDTLIMISEGVDPAAYVDKYSAVDAVARKVLQPAYYELPIGFTNAGAGNGSNTVTEPPFEDADRLLRVAINQVGPAILGFTEARKTYLNGNDLYTDILDPIYPWRVSTKDNNYTETGIASRFPILSSGVGRCSDADPLAANSTGRKYVWANINVCGHIIYVMCAHLTGNYEYNYSTNPPHYSRRIEIEDICAIFSALVAEGKSGILLTDGNFNGDRVNPSVEYELAFFEEAGLVVLNGLYMPRWGVSQIDHIMVTPDLMFHSMGEKVAAAEYASDHPFLGGVVGIKMLEMS